MWRKEEAVAVRKKNSYNMLSVMDHNGCFIYLQITPGEND